VYLTGQNKTEKDNMIELEKLGKDPIVLKIFSIFRECYLVGGSIRDALQSKELKDYDFAVPNKPWDTRVLLENAGVPTIPEVGEQYGTIMATIDGKSVEITTYRSRESYTPGSRHPVVQFGKEIHEDLRRRDFTINAMAMGQGGMLLDLYDGLGDLEDGVIRTPLDPELTFIDDPLRILRAARFISKLGFKPALALTAAAKTAAKDLNNISAERKAMEMRQILLGYRAQVALQWMADTTVLTTIMPEFLPILAAKNVPQGKMHSKDIWEHTLGVVTNSTPLLAVRWAALLHDLGKPSCRTEKDGEVHFYGHEDLGGKTAQTIVDRFKLSNDLGDEIVALCANHMRANLYDNTWSNGSIRRLMRHMGPWYDDLLELSKADITSHREDKVAAKLSVLAELQERSSAISIEDEREPILPTGIGTIIMEAFDLKPSREVGNLKKRLEDAIIDEVLPKSAPIETYIKWLKDSLR
jgi:poly(A) polymerase